MQYSSIECSAIKALHRQEYKSDASQMNEQCRGLLVYTPGLEHNCWVLFDRIRFAAAVQALGLKNSRNGGKILALLMAAGQTIGPASVSTDESNVIGRFNILLIILLNSVAAFAVTTTLGASDAVLCFQESRILLSSRGLQHCNRAIKQGDLTKRDLAATYSNRGIILSNSGHYERAIRDHNKAISLKPDLAQAYINRGNVYHHLSRFEEALNDYQKAMQLANGPRHIPYYNSGLTLLRLNRKEEAISAFERALEFAPDSANIKKKLAVARSF